ncbi:unnamed protein product, partial [Meganyctiphanes norvegica]
EKTEDAGSSSSYNSGDYPEALRAWMNQLYQWQCFTATFPYFMATLHAQASIQNLNGSPVNIPNSTQQPTTVAAQTPNPIGSVQTPQQTDRSAQQQQVQQPQPQQQQQPLPQRGK